MHSYKIKGKKPLGEEEAFKTEGEANRKKRIGLERS